MLAFLLRLLDLLIKARQEPLQAPVAAPAPTLADPSTKPASDSLGAAAATFAAPFEGCSLTPYRDPVGVWTIGYGSTHDNLGNPVCATTAPVTEPDAQALLARDMGAALRCVLVEVKEPLTPNQTIALADFVYNLGAGNFHSSTLLRKLNDGDYAGAAVEFDKWDHAGGKVLAGLLKRREAETKLFEVA